MDTLGTIAKKKLPDFRKAGSKLPEQITLLCTPQSQKLSFLSRVLNLPGSWDCLRLDSVVEACSIDCCNFTTASHALIETLGASESFLTFCDEVIDCRVLKKKDYCTEL